MDLEKIKDLIDRLGDLELELPDKKTQRSVKRFARRLVDIFLAAHKKPQRGAQNAPPKAQPKT